MATVTARRAATARARRRPAHNADHRRRTEDLLEQLADLLQQDKLTREVWQARRRRAVARRAIARRLIDLPVQTPG